MPKSKLRQDERHRKPRPAEAAFDIWLQKGLHQLFDDVASEPVPAELLRMIEEDRLK